MQPRISIIVPCYNGEKYLWDCVRSLMEQTLTDGVEFLFINDGSTDKTLELLHEYVDRYPKLLPQVRIVNNERNLGISQTRKLGIKEAQGEYIAWVDCDDWVEPEMIESLYNATQGENVDIVVQNVTLNIFKGEEESINEWYLYKSSSPYEALKLYYTDKYVPWGLPFQFSRKRLIEQCSVKVHDVNYTEDAIMLIYLFAIANSCVWLERSYYHYRNIEESNSLTRRNYQTKEEWEKQKKNITEVSNFLTGRFPRREIIHTVNYIKWRWKKSFIPVFDNSWDYWSEYSECYRSINIYNPTSLSKPWKNWLRYNIFVCYWFLEGRHLYKKSSLYKRFLLNYDKIMDKIF